MSKTFEYNLQAGQNLTDVATQFYGSIDSLLQLCIDNNIEVGATVEVGSKLILRESNVVSKKLITYYKNKHIDIATGGLKEMSNWILANGAWNDMKFWIDNEYWKDN